MWMKIACRRWLFLKIELLTIFPEVFDSFLNTSIIGRARDHGLLDIHATDIRPFSASKHKNTDDYPFGGGAGMLMMAQPIADAMKAVTQLPFHGKRIFMGPRGQKLTQRLAQELAGEEELVILCGHYEGVDQRALDHYIDMEISIGDYILTGGETAAMVLIDCVSRLIPGVLGSEESTGEESFSAAGLLEYPQYTRPRIFEGVEVPEVLLSGDHKKIAQWRREQALLATARLRPDLLDTADITEGERKWLREKLINIETLSLLDLQPSQFYISEEKLCAVRQWFNPEDLTNFNAIPVKMLDGEPVMTDGHTRAVAALMAGIKKVPLVLETDDLDWEMYKACVTACRERNVRSPQDLMMRVITSEEYCEKWDAWCDQMQSDIKKGKRSRKTKDAQTDQGKPDNP